jgi:hypothetical protein
MAMKKRVGFFDALRWCNLQKKTSVDAKLLTMQNFFISGAFQWVLANPSSTKEEVINLIEAEIRQEILMQLENSYVHLKSSVSYQ